MYVSYIHIPYTIYTYMYVFMYVCMYVLSPFADKPTCNHDKECSNHHPSQSLKSTGTEL